MEEKNIKIKDLEIKNFKGIKELKIENLNKINVFIGDNNSKKTTILEAIALMNRYNTDNLKTILLNRKYTTHKNSLDSFFYNLKLKNHPLIVIKDYKNKEQKLEILSDHENSEILEENNTIFTNEEKQELDKISYNYNFLMNDKENVKIEVIGKNGKLISLKGNSNKVISYIPAGRNLSFFINNLREIQKAKQIDKIIEISKKYNTELEKIYLDGENIYVDLKNINKSLSISSMGEGFISILTIISNFILTNCKEKVILIDEIENGLYRTKLKELIRFILDFIQENNVQLFITTHSEEFLREFYKLVSEKSNIVNLYRLENSENGIKTILYSEKEAKEAMAEGWEIR